MSRLTTLLQHPDNVLTVFEARYSEDYYAVVGPSAFAQIMSDALKGGDPDYAHAYYNHVCNTWFPVSLAQFTAKGVNAMSDREKSELEDRYKRGQAIHNVITPLQQLCDQVALDMRFGERVGQSVKHLEWDLEELDSEISKEDTQTLLELGEVFIQNQELVDALSPNATPLAPKMRAVLNQLRSEQTNSNQEKNNNDAH